MAKIIIPTPLRKFTGGQNRYETDKNQVQPALNDLVDAYPDLRTHLYDEQGNLRNFIKVFVGEDDIKSLDGGNTAVSQETVISIVPAIAGGAK